MLSSRKLNRCRLWWSSEFVLPRWLERFRSHPCHPELAAAGRPINKELVMTCPGLYPSLFYTCCETHESPRTEDGSILVPSPPNCCREDTNHSFPRCRQQFGGEG